MNKLKIGVIGVGKSTGISAGYVRGVKDNEEAYIAGAFDLRRENAMEWCKLHELPETIIYDDWKKMVDDMDIICISTPNSTHANYLIYCLEHNKNAFCEKPVSHDAADIPAILEAQEKSTAKAMVNLGYRFLPAVREIHDFVASGKAGKIYLFRECMGAPRLANEAVPLEWRFVRKLSGSGAIGDFGSHAFDLLHYIVGEDESRITDVIAKQSTCIAERMKGDTLAKVENEDIGTCICRLNNGGLFNLTLSRIGMPEPGFEIVAEKAIITFKLTKPTEYTLQVRNNREYFGAVELKQAVCDDVWKNLQLKDMVNELTAENLQSFIRCIVNHEPVPQDAAYACMILTDIERTVKAAGGE